MNAILKHAETYHQEHDGHNEAYIAKKRKHKSKIQHQLDIAKEIMPLGSEALWEYAKERFIKAEIESGNLIDDTNS